MKIVLMTSLPEKPLEFLKFLRREFHLKEEDIFKLYYLTLRIKALSDLPIYKFLERAVPFIKFDEVEKRTYLLTLSVHTMREILIEHFDLKFSKNLYLSLKEEIPKEFFKECIPKREILVSQDLFFEYLSMEKVATLPPFLKVKHLIFYFLGEAPCEEILSLLSTLSYFVIKKEGDELVKVFMPLSISEFLYFSNLWVKEDIITDKEREGLIFQLKGYIPECFSSI